MKKHLCRKFFVLLFSLVMIATASFALAACGKKEAGPETGSYYYETELGETYYVTLTGGDKVSLLIKGETLWGDYKLSDGTFGFTLNSDAKIEGSYADNTVTIVMDGSQMIFRKAENYTVSFDTNGGSSVASQKVLNGKSAVKPADPAKDGYAFVGWYSDSAFTTPYSFGATIITGDATLYARWSDRLTVSNVYTVDFDLGYEGAKSIPAVSTVDGRIYDVPAPAREGYTFGGWWISDFEAADKLTSIYEDGYVFNANATLFAQWTNNSAASAAPAPSVKGDSVVWTAVKGASAYDVTVVGANGNVLVSTRTGSTNVSVPFSSSAEGEYKITVSAVTASGSSSEAAVRYYNNKALARVSLFEVIEPSSLVFVPVDGAEKYTVNVVCGNGEHNHSAIDNGTSTYFDFSGCAMSEDGIRFTVTASAAGKASSVSETFAFKRSLEKIENIYFNETTETLSWNQIKYATDYKVVINGETVILTGGKTSVSLRNFATSPVTAEVIPCSNGYISPEAASYRYERKRLVAPAGLKIEKSVLSWNAVAGATSYVVSISGQEYAAEGTSFDLSTATLANGVDYEIAVKAVGATESVYSDALEAQYLTISESLIYAKNTVSWRNVIGAKSYNVTVNGEAFTAEAGVTSFKITLTQKGENEITVQAALEDGTSTDTVSVSVYAYEISFDSREGTPADTIYAAAGDTVVLPSSEREGFDLTGWYNVAGASSANGTKYAGEFVFDRIADLVLYANWSPKTYKANYVLPEGATADTAEGDVRYTRNYRLAVPALEDASKVFIGWFSQEDGRGEQLTDAEGYSLSVWNDMGDATVYAYFAEIFDFRLQTEGINKDTYSVVMKNEVFRVSKVRVPETYNGKKVTIIEGAAFRNCSTLRSIEIPDTIRIIYYTSAFEKCTALSEIVIYETGHNAEPNFSSADGVLYYTSNAATEGKELVFIPAARTGSVVISSGVRSIGESAFTGSKIRTVTIPATVNNIAVRAFENSKYLTDIYFDLNEGDELMVGKNAFSGCTALKSLNIPARYATFDPTVLGDSTSIENIHVAEDHETYSSVNGLLCNKDGNELIYCPAGRRGALRIPSGIRTIGKSAFANCNNITSVIIPSFVTRIENNAFEGCSKLTSVTFAGGTALGSSLSLGNNVFANCVSLSKVTFENNSNVAALGDGAFSGCSKLTSVKLPATLQNVSAKLFDGCANLVNIEVEESSNYLSAENSILYDKAKTRMIYYPSYKSDTEFIVPETIEVIDANLFKGNVSLEKIIFGKNVREIGASAFEGCANLMKVVFVTGGENELVIGERAFASCSAFEGIYIADSATTSEDEYELGTPATLRTIGAYAFTESQFGGRLVLSEGVETIGKSAFEATSFITSVTFPESLKEIGDNAFNRIRMLRSVTFATDENGKIKSNLETIGESAFNSTKITSFNVPASVTKIGDSAFSISNLNKFTFEEGRTEKVTLGLSVFSGSALTSIVLPKDLCEVTYDTKTRGYLMTTFDSAWNLADIQNMPENDKYAYEGGVFYELNSDGVKTIVDHANLENNAYVIPNTVTLVRSGAFYGCSGSTLTFEAGGTDDLVFEDGVFNNSRMKTVEFPARLKKLGNELFSYAKTEKVTFVDTDSEPSRLEEIPYAMFKYADNLTEIEIPRSVKKIGNEAFWPGESFFGPVKVLTKITLHDGLEEIGDRAFSNDSNGGAAFTELVIPSTVKSIGNFAFSNNKKLQSVTFAKNAEGKTSLEKLGAGVFMNTAITSITIPKTLAKGVSIIDWESMEEKDGILSDSMFMSCNKLTEVVFEDGCPLVTEYGSNIFAGCTAYSVVTFPVNLEKMGKWDEYNQGGAIKSITIPKAVDEEALKSFVPSLTGVTEFALDKDNPYLYQDGANGAIYNKAKNVLLYYPANLTQESYTVLPTTVTISERAFYENKYLKTIKLPEGLVKIGNYAFGVSTDARSTAITGIEIPSTVEEIGERAFFGAAELKTLTFLKDANGNCALKRIGNSAFRHCSSLEEVELPFGLEILGENAGWGDDDVDANASVFYDCASLKKVTLPGKVADLQAHVFAECPALTTVIFPKGCAFTRIAYYAFYNSGLTSIDFTNANGLAIIDHDAFNGCSNLATIKFAGTKNNLEILDYAFANTAVETIDLPSGVITIGAYAFYNAADLRAVNIETGSNLQTVGAYAFNGTALASMDFSKAAALEEIGAYAFCETALDKIVLADAVTSVGNYAFYGCANVTEFRLSSSISNIGEYAFAKITKITAVTISGNDTKVGNSAFEDCSSLKDITLESGVSSIGNNAFGFTAVTSVVLPDTITSLSGNPFGGCPLESIEVLAEGADIFFDEVTKTLYNADKNILYYQTTVTTGAFVVPDTITSILAGAFAGSHITSITLPANFTRIEDGTFRNCTELKSVTIGKNIAYIGASAFEGCTSLESITFEQGGTQALTIGAKAFKDCTALKSLTIPHRLRDGGEKITKTYYIEWIDDYMDETFVCGGPGIGESAFENTGIVAIDCEEEPAAGISDSAYHADTLSIADSAFRNCKNLTKVTLPSFMSNSGEFYNREDVIKLPDPFTDEDKWSLEYKQYNYIGAYAFYGCEKLTTVTLPEQIGIMYDFGFSAASGAILGEHAFENCTALVNVGYVQDGKYVWPSYLSIIKSYTFANSGLKEVVLPYAENDWGQTVKYSIDDYAFYGCKSLVNVELHGEMSNIGEGTPVLGKYAFAECTALRTAIFDDMYAVMDGAFENCRALQKVEMTFRDSNIWTQLTKYRCVGKNAFKNCSSLSSVELSGELESIDAGAFEGCRSLMSIEIPDGVTTVAATAFAGWTAAQKITVPFKDAGSILAGYATGWNGNATIVYKG